MQPVFHRQREDQYIRDANKFPDPDWSKVDQNLKIEGIFMFGGQLENGKAIDDLYVLRPLKRGLTW